MRRKSAVTEWFDVIEGALVMVLLAALFPLVALYDRLSPPGA
jgi:hypothetical protein